MSQELIERLRMEAQIHAQEARTANATIAEIYQLCSGGKGEPGNWHGAEPVRALIAERDALAATLKAAQGGVTEAMVESLETLRRMSEGWLHPDTSALKRMYETFKAALSAQQGQGEVRCVICGAEEPYTGTCGSNDPRALCKQATRATQNTPVAEVDWKPRVDGYEVGPTEVRWLTDPPAQPAEPLFYVQGRPVHRGDVLHHPDTYATGKVVTAEFRAKGDMVTVRTANGAVPTVRVSELSWPDAQPAERVPEAVLGYCSRDDAEKLLKRKGEERINFSHIEVWNQQSEFYPVAIASPAPSPARAGMGRSRMDEKPEVIEIVPQDCAYGWRASALMSDGSIRYGTSKLHATAEDAIAEVRERLATQDTRP